ncbi:MAG: 50S ribosomal protein L10 [Myxococcales bacterium]|nr:50S ribosomal protein L10 [Polyangiaceae bacterium]MDW8251406.1 50S ribosomal protein L10 [Myxococcales bacterium]
MNHAQKTAEIGEIRNRFDRMVSAVFVDFQGLDVATLTKLRSEFRKSGVEYKVVKNTLIRHAIKDKPYAGQLDSTLAGMTGVAWSYEDPSAAAKVVTEFKKTNEKLQIKAGLIEGQVLDKQQVESQLATMPGKQELRARLLATLQAPAQTLLRLLITPSQQLATVLDAKRRKDAGE